MKHSYGASALPFLLILVMASAVLTGCKKDDNNPAAAAPIVVDPQLVGVWFSASDSTGVEIKNDGTFLQLIVNPSGNLVYEPTDANSPVYKITTPSNNNFKLTISGKSTLTGKDTSVSITGTYALSNNNNTLVTTTVNDALQPTVQLYVRSTLGAKVLSAPPGLLTRRTTAGNRVSIAKGIPVQ